MLVLFNICEIVFPLPGSAPLIGAGALTVQLKLLPITVDVNAIFVVVEPQIELVTGDAVAIGVG